MNIGKHWMQGIRLTNSTKRVRRSEVINYEERPKPKHEWMDYAYDAKHTHDTKCVLTQDVQIILVYSFDYRFFVLTADLANRSFHFQTIYIYFNLFEKAKWRSTVMGLLACADRE